MTAVAILRDLWTARIQRGEFIRNRLPVITVPELALRQQLNRLIAYRGKAMFHRRARVDSVPKSGGAGARERWRFFGRTGPMTTHLNVSMVIADQSDTAAMNPFGQLQIYKSDGSLLGELVRYYGAGAGTATDTLDAFARFRGAIMNIPADTEIYGVWSDHDSARLVGGTVWEGKAEHDTVNGYLSNVAVVGEPILDRQREQLASLTNQLWRAGRAQTWCWSRESAPLTRTAASDVNVIDGTSTTVTAATPGATLDLTGKDRARGGGLVRVEIRVYAEASSSAGEVKLKDSGGATLASIGPFTAAGWYSGGTSLPAVADKYDLTLASDGAATVSLYAVSIYEQL